MGSQCRKAESVWGGERSGCGKPSPRIRGKGGRTSINDTSSETRRGGRLLDRMKLFPSGGHHETVSRDVEAFDRLLYAEWESGLKPMNDKEKRIEFREFLAHRAKTWGEEYLQWLKTR
jgi:hypothetical protein